MHYKNGRVAKAGDKVLSLEHGQVGMLHSVVEGSDSCNGRLAPSSQNDTYITVGKCLHIDDVQAADVPDSTVTPHVPV